MLKKFAWKYGATVCKRRFTSSSCLLMASHSGSTASLADKKEEDTKIYSAIPPIVPNLPTTLSNPTPFSHFLTSPRQCAIVGAPLADGQTRSGVDEGPEAIRKAGLVHRLIQDEWIVNDIGDLHFKHSNTHTNTTIGRKTSLEQPVLHSENNPETIVNRAFRVGSANKQLHDVLKKEAQKNQFCLTLGGDHSVGIGSISGMMSAQPDLCVIWVDAHADINTPRSSLSHNSHGMVVSFLMGLENTRKINGFEWLQSVPILQPQRLVYVALRDLDAAEKQLLKALNIKCFTMHDVDRYGIARVMERALDHVIGRAPRPLHLSLDIDSIDPLFAPSTGTRVNGGLTYREGYYVCEECAASGCMTSMDLVEVNPQLFGKEDSQSTVNMAIGLISSAMGNKIL